MKKWMALMVVVLTLGLSVGVVDAANGSKWPDEVLSRSEHR